MEKAWRPDIMVAAVLIGRLLLGGFFIISGLNHFTSYAMSVQFAAAKGVPAPEMAVPLSGLLILFGGVSLVLGWKPQWGIAAIVLFLVGVSFPMHNFWAESGAARMNDMANFMKNTAIAGATLML